jgi:type I restriction enzyme M protein
MKYESTFNAIDKILRNEAGCSNELDYIEQTSWLLFLKYLDDLETEMEFKAELENKTYHRIVTGFHRWSSWAAPKTATGELDKINAMTGDDLVSFVNTKLFPNLAKFKDSATDSRSLEYKIGEIFSEIKNKIQSGYNLRDIIDKIDSLKFQSADDKHEMTVLYEDKIRRMGNAGRNGGEYYTPRPLIRSIIQVVNPRIGETVYDPACGSAGFLCEAFNYMQEQIGSTADSNTLQKKTFFGKEKKPLPYIIATMNMIFHGIAAPNIVRGNTLSENLTQIQEKDRHNVILANPPFGGSERQDVQQNFPIKTSETAYMFMQHFVKMLKAGGRAGIVIKNTFLSNADATELRKMLLEETNLHTILDLPQGVFTGAGVRTVVLFFDKGKATKNVWYYQLNPGRTLGKTTALTEEDMEEFVRLQKSRKEGPNSWLLNVSELGKDYDLSVRNPNKVEETDERSPMQIALEIEELNSQNANLLKEIMQML